jgi:hypothetical protein
VRRDQRHPRFSASFRRELLVVGAFFAAMVLALVVALVVDAVWVFPVVWSIGVLVPLWRLRVERGAYVVTAACIVGASLAVAATGSDGWGYVGLVPWGLAWVRAKFALGPASDPPNP